jgi:hypothetical protein
VEFVAAIACNGPLNSMATIINEKIWGCQLALPMVPPPLK